MTPFDQGFTAGDIRKAVQASKAQLNHWVASGAIVPRVRVAQSSGDAQIFDGFNLLQAAVCAELTRFKVMLPIITWLVGVPLERAWTQHTTYLLLIVQPPTAVTAKGVTFWRFKDGEVLSKPTTDEGDAVVLRRGVIGTNDGSEVLAALEQYPAALVIHLNQLRQRFGI